MTVLLASFAPCRSAHSSHIEASVRADVAYARAKLGDRLEAFAAWEQGASLLALKRRLSLVADICRTSAERCPWARGLVSLTRVTELELRARRAGPFVPLRGRGRSRRRAAGIRGRGAQSASAMARARAQRLRVGLRRHQPTRDADGRAERFSVSSHGSPRALAGRHCSPPTEPVHARSHRRARSTCQRPRSQRDRLRSRASSARATGQLRVCRGTDASLATAVAGRPARCLCAVVGRARQAHSLSDSKAWRALARVPSSLVRCTNNCAWPSACRRTAAMRNAARVVRCPRCRGTCLTADPEHARCLNAPSGTPPEACPNCRACGRLPRASRGTR